MQTNTNKYYVYAHINKDNGEIFYICKGTGGIVTGKQIGRAHV